MRHNPQNDRWTVRTGEREYGLHCGETFDLVVEGQPYPCRLEMAETWYVILGNVGLALRPREVYQVRM
ncbi:DUF5348 domain-containing protein [Alicyclobacillus cycloheptanicus]|nr:DUF5348 domain-containing protein [Alicyclobacillus cycloheptanicus]